MKHSDVLHLGVCPHCGIAQPLLVRRYADTSSAHDGTGTRVWAFYLCSTCGGYLMACSPSGSGSEITDFWPPIRQIPDSVPSTTRDLLSQAMASLHAPAGAVMLAASAVDAMLKEKGYKDGSLNARIDRAAADHLITAEMGAWAHEIRLDANDQRHADESVGLPDVADARKAVEFASALVQFLFVLPARVERGRKVPIAQSA